MPFGSPSRPTTTVTQPPLRSRLIYWERWKNGVITMVLRSELRPHTFRVVATINSKRDSYRDVGREIFMGRNEANSSLQTRVNGLLVRTSCARTLLHFHLALALDLDEHYFDRLVTCPGAGGDTNFTLAKNWLVAYKCWPDMKSSSKWYPFLARLWSASETSSNLQATTGSRARCRNCFRDFKMIASVYLSSLAPTATKELEHWTAISIMGR